MNKSQHDENKTFSEHSLAYSILIVIVIILLIAATLWGIHLNRKALSLLLDRLLDRHSEEVMKFTVYAGFCLISSFVALVIFGILRGTGIFRRTSKQGQYYEFGGAMAGFFVVLVFLIESYSIHTSSQPLEELRIIGNVRFIDKSKNPIGPVSGAKISLSGYSEGWKTETNKEGNFTLRLPGNKMHTECELQITYGEKTFYKTIQLLEIENSVKVEIEIIEIQPIQKSSNINCFSESYFTRKERYLEVLIKKYGEINKIKKEFRICLENEIHYIDQEIIHINELYNNDEIEKARLVEKIKLLTKRINENQYELEISKDGLVDLRKVIEKEKGKDTKELSILDEEIKKLEQALTKLEAQGQALADINYRIDI